MPETKKYRDEFAAFKQIWFVITILGVLLYYQSHLGLFTIQPNSTLPEGFTAVVWREAGTPFFNSPDAMCLKIMGNVSSVCRTVAMWESLVDRIIFRLPYSRWAYLRSTGGLDYQEVGEFLIP